MERAVAEGAGCKRSEKRSEKRGNSGDECRRSLCINKYIFHNIFILFFTYSFGATRSLKRRVAPLKYVYAPEYETRWKYSDYWLRVMALLNATRGLIVDVQAGLTPCTI